MPEVAGGPEPSQAEQRFRALFADYYRPVLGYALRRFEPRATAEDVVAETFLVAWRRIDDVPEGHPALAWLFGVARRVGANVRRGDARRDRLVQAMSQGRPETERQVDESVAGSETRQLVLAALDRIRPAHAEVLRLVAWEELTRPEIAVVLGCSTNAVGIRVHRARRALASELRKALPESEHLLDTQPKPEVRP